MSFFLRTRYVMVKCRSCIYRWQSLFGW